MEPVTELDGDEDVNWDNASWRSGFEAAVNAARDTDREFEDRCKRAAFELRNMLGNWSLDGTKILRILEGK